jgi:hypothetical protein
LLQANPNPSNTRIDSDYDLSAATFSHDTPSAMEVAKSGICHINFIGRSLIDLPDYWWI